MQAYSIKSLRRLFDMEQRRGADLVNRFFPEQHGYRIELKENKQQRKDIHKKKNAGIIDENEYKTGLANNTQRLEEIKSEKEESLMESIAQIQREIDKKDFHLKLVRIEKTAGPTYWTIQQNDKAGYFAIRECMRLLRIYFNIDTQDRNGISRDLYHIFYAGIPLTIFRMDVVEFYESIRLSRIINILKSNVRIDYKTMKLVSDVVKRFQYTIDSENQRTGIPRGAALSAILSELYIRGFDELVKNDPKVLYYARYVDDIVIVCRLLGQSEREKFENNIRMFASDIHLKLHDTKGKYEVVDVNTKLNSRFKISYLGYTFSKNGNNLPCYQKKNNDFKRDDVNNYYRDTETDSRYHNSDVIVRLSENKVEKYISKIDSCFAAYHKEANHNPFRAIRRLIARLRFLTSNTRLLKSKGNVFVGIYYSHSLLNRTEELKMLDKYMFRLAREYKISLYLLKKKKISFLHGFYYRTFIKYRNSEQVKKLTKGWIDV